MTFFQKKKKEKTLWSFYESKLYGKVKRLIKFLFDFLPHLLDTSQDSTFLLLASTGKEENNNQKKFLRLFGVSTKNKFSIIMER